MKLLLLSDRESPYLWDHYQPGRLKPYDLILSCGDLKASYLSFLVTMGRGPLLYVHGNHDANYSRRPPEGLGGFRADTYGRGRMSFLSKVSLRTYPVLSFAVAWGGRYERWNPPVRRYGQVDQGRA